VEQMDGPCCVGVVRDASSLAGTEVSCGGAPAYVATPTTESARKKVGVLVIHDIWGWRIPNSKYIADYFAAHGFVALCPNLYHGNSNLDGWPGTEFDDGEALDGPSWESWWTEITSEAFWKKFHNRVDASVALLKDAGCTSMCVIGFCWGGLAIEQLSAKGIFSKAASCHGCHENADNYHAANAAGCTIEYHTVPGDDSFPAPAQELLKEAGASVIVYDGMEHGFVVRGDFKGNAALKEAADRCLATVVLQFGQAA